MDDGSLARWQEQNREFLAMAVDDLLCRMEETDGEQMRLEMAGLRERMEAPPAIDHLVETFSLGPFERDVVMLCVGSEVDPRFRAESRPVTVGLALEELDGANWAALDSAAPLRSWGIVTTNQMSPLADAPIRLAGDILRVLLGFDPRLESDSPFTLLAPPLVLLERQLALGEELARALTRTAEVTGESPAVELHGATPEDRDAIAIACARSLGASVASADARDLPPAGPELDALLQGWSRRARLTSSLLSITVADPYDEDPSLRHRIDRCLARLSVPLFLSVVRPTTLEPARPLLRRSIEPLDADERLELWRIYVDATRTRLGSRRTSGLGAALEAIAGDFRLGARTIQRVCLEAEGTLLAEGRNVDPARLAALLRAGCAQAVRSRLDPLADRITLEVVRELALPEQEARQFIELEFAIRLATEVGVRWGLGQGRVNGITALFAGPSGTGKTHAAFVLARRLGLDLYRVSLASVLSKYIGETEKNLDRIFDAASIGGIILLFDEADALFGKRSEVRDSHDRYANLSTAYLLSRIENAPTPTILTTNMKEAIDPAFVRRLQFVIDFPFPTASQRVEIWRDIYPEQTPVGVLQPERLSVLAATGGTITNIARRGAYLAAAEPTTVEMHHLSEASRSELRKLGRELTPDELDALG